jgi:hypothetical protein
VSDAVVAVGEDEDEADTDGGLLNDDVDDECGFLSIFAHVLKSEQTRHGFLGCFESCAVGSDGVTDGAMVSGNSFGFSNNNTKQ